MYFGTAEEFVTAVSAAIGEKLWPGGGAMYISIIASRALTHFRG